MSRLSVPQTKRTQKDPLVLGSFDTTSIRYLKGKLGPRSQVVGRADTSSESNGGFGGGAYNHWFQINLKKPAWIIVKKGPPRPQYIQTSVYDLNKTPIVGQAIFDADSLTTIDADGEVYIPYLNTVTSVQSDLYNQFSASRLDKGDERYYPLSVGSYLLCISTTRNELLDYAVAVVIEVPTQVSYLELEDTGSALALQETTYSSNILESPIEVDTFIDFPTNAFSQAFCAINDTITVTIEDQATWIIGFAILPEDLDDYKIVLEPGDDAYYDTVHDHSLTEWQTAWRNSHHQDDPFPEILIPLTNRP